MFGYFYRRKQAKKDLSSGKNFLLFNNCSVSEWLGNSGFNKIKDVNTKLLEQEVCSLGVLLAFFMGMISKGRSYND